MHEVMIYPREMFHALHGHPYHESWRITRRNGIEYSSRLFNVVKCCGVYFDVDADTWHKGRAQRPYELYKRGSRRQW